MMSKSPISVQVSVLRTHFLEIENRKKIIACTNNIYTQTINILKGSKEQYDVNDTIDDLEDVKFSELFKEWMIAILETIRYKTSFKHTDNCIVRAVFDILFKYIFEFGIPPLCCTSNDFKKLEFNILTDFSWNWSTVFIERIKLETRNDFTKTKESC